MEWQGKLKSLSTIKINTQRGALYKYNSIHRLSGVENQLLIGSNSHVNAITWSSSMTSIGNVDIICFGHLLFEMSTGYELLTHTPTKHDLQLELHRFPQVFLQ